MVEGPCPAYRDRLSRTNSIRQDKRGGNASYYVAVVFEKPRSDRISACSTTNIVCEPINFDNQSRGEAAEIGHIRPDRVLAAEFQALWAQPQLLPEQDFGQSHRFAQRTGLPDYRAQCVGRYPSTTLRVVPLPGSGRIGNGKKQRLGQSNLGCCAVAVGAGFART